LFVFHSHLKLYSTDYEHYAASAASHWWACRLNVDEAALATNWLFSNRSLLHRAAGHGALEIATELSYLDAAELLYSFLLGILIFFNDMKRSLISLIDLHSGLSSTQFLLTQ
jgi:hypothetical protein